LSVVAASARVDPQNPQLHTQLRALVIDKRRYSSDAYRKVYYQRFHAREQRNATFFARVEHRFSAGQLLMKARPRPAASGDETPL